MDPLTGRSRAQNKGTSRGPARAWGGDDPITRIASIESITEPAVCPDCHIMSKLVHLSGSAIAATTEQSMIPCMVMEDVLRKTRCILCTIADNAVVRAQEAHAGHIWFLIGFRNRVMVMMDWAAAYFSFTRPARIIAGGNPNDPADSA